MPKAAINNSNPNQVRIARLRFGERSRTMPSMGSNTRAKLTP